MEPERKSIATAGDDGSARVFDAHSGAQQMVATGHTSGVVGVDWDPTSTRLATASEDGTAKLWAIVGGGAHLLSTLSAHDTTSGVAWVAFSPDGNRLATGVQGDVGTAVVTIWDVRLTGGAEVGNVPAIPFNWNQAVYTPDGRYLLTSQAGGTVGVWDAISLEPVRTLGTPGATTTSGGLPAVTGDDLVTVLPSPDGRLVATRSGGSMDGDSPGEGQVRVWDVESGEERFTVDAGWRAEDVAWSPDGDLLAVAGSVRTRLDHRRRSRG